MPPLDSESQTRFLISCIHHSNCGKVDFTEVANECNIVSKGAAAKRYERLMKAHGAPMAASAASSKAGGVSNDSNKEGGAAASAVNKARQQKKRKLEAVDENAGDLDEKNIKGEVKTENAVTVKTENAKLLRSLPEAVPSPMQFDHEQEHHLHHSQSVTADDDDDDDVHVVSSTQRHPWRFDMYGGGSISDHQHHHMHHFLDQHHQHQQHHHQHQQQHPPIPQLIPGIHSFDYAANMGFPPQTRQAMNPTPPPTRSSPGQTSLSYAFTASPASPPTWQPQPQPQQHQHSHDNSQHDAGRNHSFFWSDPASLHSSCLEERKEHVHE